MSGSHLNNPQSGNRGILLILGLIVAAWGVLGWMDLSQQTQAGFNTDGNNTITQVYTDSTAERIGLKVGDRITRIEQIPVENASTIARLPRMVAGERRSFVVQRGEEMIEYFVPYTPLLQRSMSLGQAATIIGFCFLLFPIAAFFRNPCRATRVLAMVGIGLGLAFMGGPYIGAFSIRALTQVVVNLFVFFGLAAMLYFLLVFPEVRPSADKPWIKRLVYLPAFLLWALISWRLMFTPPATSMLNTATSIAAGLIIGGYFLVSLVMMLRNYGRVNSLRRKALSLNLMLWGTLAGLLPVIIGQFARVVAPQLVLPYQDYYFVALALIPMTWALSASKA